MNNENLAEQLHIWYLEASAQLHPESFNSEAQKSYADLTEEQKFLDRYIAGKVNEMWKEETVEMQQDINSILAMLDGDTDRKIIANYVREYLIGVTKK